MWRFESPSHRVISFVPLAVVFLNSAKSIWPLAPSWGITFAQLSQDGELMPGEMKQDGKAQACHYEIVDKASAALFVKDNTRGDLSRSWWERLS